MLTAGIDMGSIAAKVVLLDDKKILSHSLILSSEESAIIGDRAMAEALKKASLAIDDIEYIVSTGAGRKEVSFAEKNISEVFAIAAGVRWFFPAARTVLNMGAETCTAIECGEAGEVNKFVSNDKCAAGSGLSLEIMAAALELKIEEIGELSLRSKGKVDITSMCAVFAESEAVGYIHMGVERGDIIRGLHEAVASGALAVLNRIRIKGDVVMTGGVAKNIGVVDALKRQLGSNVLVPADPQLSGALGAAIIARNNREPRRGLR